MLQNIFVYIESVEGKPINVSLEMISAAKKISDKVTAIVIGKNIENIANIAISYGADSAIIVEDDKYAVYNSDVNSYIIEELIKKYSPCGVFIGSSLIGKDLAPRVAAKFSTGCVADVVDVKIDGDQIVFTSPVYGGTILANAVQNGSLQMATIRSGAFSKSEADTSRTGEIIKETITVPEGEIRAKIMETVKEIAETVNLEDAEVIVTGGRGMGSEENYELVKELAEVLGGVVGATRPAIEAGWVSRAHQVGQSGKIVSPKLYIACGVSGATQHVSGMVGSGYIVAINKDEEAPIFDVANVGIVGNVNDIIPLMIEEFKKAKA